MIIIKGIDNTEIVFYINSAWIPSGGAKYFDKPPCVILTEDLLVIPIMLLEKSLIHKQIAPFQ